MLNIIGITGKQTTYFKTTEQRPVYNRSKGHTFSHGQVSLQEGTTIIIVINIYSKSKRKVRRYLHSVGAWKKILFFWETWNRSILYNDQTW